MTRTPAETRPHRRQRPARLVSNLLAAALATWLVWIALTRWNGLPANPAGDNGIFQFCPLIPIDPEWDRTDELVAALQALPPDPALQLPPAPPGMKWFVPFGGIISLHDALNGDWTPESRPHLRAIIEHLENPATQAALGRIAAIEPGGWRPFQPGSPGFSGYVDVRRAARLLVARSRYHRIHCGDPDAAWADISAVHRLGTTMLHSGIPYGVIIAQSINRLANTELIHQSRERDLTPAEAAKIIPLLQDQVPDAQQMWHRFTDDWIELTQRWMDLGWTDDGHGDGWLVLSHFDDLAIPVFAGQRRSGCWNALSIAYNDRRTVAGKIDRYRTALDRLAKLPYAEAAAWLQDDRVREPFNLADGPLMFVFEPVRRHHLDGVVFAAAAREAAMAATALSAFRHDHGRYPDAFGDLLETCLSRTPNDPFAGRPLRYERQGQSYLLYSVGPDGDDDGGRKYDHRVDPKTGRPLRDGDINFSNPRQAPYNEPRLEAL